MPGNPACRRISKICWTSAGCDFTQAEKAGDNKEEWAKATVPIKPNTMIIAIRKNAHLLSSTKLSILLYVFVFSHQSHIFFICVPLGSELGAIYVLNMAANLKILAIV